MKQKCFVGQFQLDVIIIDQLKHTFVGITSHLGSLSFIWCMNRLSDGREAGSFSCLLEDFRLLFDIIR
jgi:hypothetical protein